MPTVKPEEGRPAAAAMTSAADIAAGIREDFDTRMGELGEWPTGRRAWVQVETKPPAGDEDAATLVITVAGSEDFEITVRRKTSASSS